MSLDPTAQDMRDYLRSLTGHADTTMDIEDAIYWFAHKYHGGMSSNLYAALCYTGFNPSPLARGPGSPEARQLKRELEAVFAGLSRR